MSGGLIASAILGGIADVYGQVSANRQNKDMAYQQMNFQADMSNTAYQRATADMKTAGLNPMLAYSQGGASTPSGASSVTQPVKLGNMVQSAFQAKQLSTDLQNTQAQTALTAASIPGAAADSRFKETTAREAELSLLNKVRLLQLRRNQGDKEEPYFGENAESDAVSRASKAGMEERDEMYQQRQRGKEFDLLDQRIRKAAAEALKEEYGVPRARRDRDFVAEFPEEPWMKYLPDWARAGYATGAFAASRARKFQTVPGRGDPGPGVSKLRPNLDLEAPFPY